MGLIYDIAKVLIGKNEGVEKAASTAVDMRSALRDNNAITKMAKDAIFTYPVIVSESVAAYNDELVEAICQYYEGQYSVFTLIAMGMDPIMDSTGAVKNHVMKFYTEEDGEDEFIEKEIPQDDLNVVKMKSTGNGTGRGVKDGTGPLNPDKHVRRELDNCLKPYKTPVEDEISTEAKNNKRPSNKESSNKESSNKEDDNGVANYAMIKLLEKKNKLAPPTMIEVSMKLKNDTKVDIPLAIKSVLHIITSEESEGIFNYLAESKPVVLAIKFLSGEIKLFRDIILQVGRARKDKQLYAKLGRHPWFRQLIGRADKSKFLKLVKFVPGLKDFLELDSKKQVLPICSLVITKDEITKGIGSYWRAISKNLDDLLRKMMLLSITIVDTDSDTVEVIYYGLKDSYIMRASDVVKDYLGKHSKNDKDVSKLLETLIYKV